MTLIFAGKKINLPAINSILLNYIHELYLTWQLLLYFKNLTKINPEQICGYFGNIKLFLTH